MSARVFVAGATGVLGRRVVPALVAAGHRVSANVRDDRNRLAVAAAGAEPITVDLFNGDAVAAAIAGHDVVVNLATAIPTGPSAGQRRAWKMNDRLRSVAASNLARATPRQGRYIGESITFPYVDGGDDWVTETTDRDHSWATRSVADAESAAADSGGVTLRFAMFWADDSAHHADLMRLARVGMFGLPGVPDAYCSWVHVDDAASAVVAAMEAPPGVYNVAEPDPQPRRVHAAALARRLGRRRLRGVPSVAVKLGGPPVEALARSHRIDTSALGRVTAWESTRRISEMWDAAAV